MPRPRSPRGTSQPPARALGDPAAPNSQQQQAPRAPRAGQTEELCLLGSSSTKPIMARVLSSPAINWTVSAHCPWSGWAKQEKPGHRAGFPSHSQLPRHRLHTGGLEMSPGQSSHAPLLSSAEPSGQRNTVTLNVITTEMSHTEMRATETCSTDPS